MLLVTRALLCLLSFLFLVCVCGFPMRRRWVRGMQVVQLRFADGPSDDRMSFAGTTFRRWGLG